ncbi:MAG TPA: hypothetical protein VKQ08_03030 [Cyclobacteriaceae bacterium]|nr:hypothetical protein [Cyclobacteriaceae bacterium]
MEYGFFKRIGWALTVTTSLFLSEPAKAQLTLSVNSGIGTYQMGDLKSYQQSALARWPVKGQVTSSFPAYWFFELAAANRMDNHLLLGGTLSFGSTGGRMFYGDYSGSLSSNQLLSFSSWTVCLGKWASLLNDKLIVEGDIRPGIVVSRLELKNQTVIGATTNNVDVTYQSVNFTVQPTLSVSYRLGPAFLKAFGGYNFNLVQDPLQQRGDGSYLLNGTGKVRADWSGLRAGLGVGMTLDSKKDEQANGYISLGLGAGLDYGGFGVNVLAYPHYNIGVFAGAGYALAGFGSNAGLKLRTGTSDLPKGLYFLGMYGYNTAVAVRNSNFDSKIFYGMTFGAGFDLRPRASGYWSFALLIPVRGPEADVYINGLKSQGIQFNNTLLPLAVSAGFRFARNGTNR